jgi:hypothetical protein
MDDLGVPPWLGKPPRGWWPPVLRHAAANEGQQSLDGAFALVLADTLNAPPLIRFDKYSTQQLDAYVDVCIIYVYIYWMLKHVWSYYMIYIYILYIHICIWSRPLSPSLPPHAPSIRSPTNPKQRWMDWSWLACCTCYTGYVADKGNKYQTILHTICKF